MDNQFKVHLHGQNDHAPLQIMVYNDNWVWNTPSTSNSPSLDLSDLNKISTTTTFLRTRHLPKISTQAIRPLKCLWGETLSREAHSEELNKILRACSCAGLRLRHLFHTENHQSAWMIWISISPPTKKPWMGIPLAATPGHPRFLSRVSTVLC